MEYTPKANFSDPLYKWWVCLADTCSLEQQTELHMLPFILKLKGTLRWGVRYQLSWKSIIVYSLQYGGGVSASDPISLSPNNAAKHGAKHEQLRVVASDLISSHWLWYFFLLHHMNMRASLVLHLYFFVSHFFFTVDQKKKEKPWHKEGRGPFDWREAGDHRRQKQTLFQTRWSNKHQQ